MTVDILTGKCYPSFMAKYSDSKEKTLLAAARLFCRQGYHGTALQDILAARRAARSISSSQGAKTQSSNATSMRHGDCRRRVVDPVYSPPPHARTWSTNAATCCEGVSMAMP
jgi:hypothetical protein